MTLLIENACVLTRKGIQGELQAILLDAMRLKDEDGETDVPCEKEAASIQSQHKDAEPRSSLDDLTRLKRLVINFCGSADAIIDAREETGLTEMLSSLQMFGNIVGAGPLKALISDQSSGDRVLVMASDPPLYLQASQKVTRDVLVETVLDF